MNREKKVDEAWKDTVSKERDKDIFSDQETPSSSAGEMQLNFINYISSLALQALIFLGEIPNPMDENKTEQNLPQAKFLIDTLILLRDKTKGNLNEEEDNLLSSSIYELQIKYAEKTKEQE